MIQLQPIQAAPSAAPDAMGAARLPLVVELGRGGATLIYPRRYSATGYVDERRQTHEADPAVHDAIAAGCAVIDTRPMGFRQVTEWALKGPLIDVSCGADPDRLYGAPTPGLGLDGCGYNCFARAPLAVVARLAEARGAYVRNVEGL